MKGFFSKCDQIRSFLRIWSHLLNKSLMENFTFRAVIMKKANTNKLTDLTLNQKRSKEYNCSSARQKDFFLKDGFNGKPRKNCMFNSRIRTHDFSKKAKEK